MDNYIFFVLGIAFYTVLVFVFFYRTVSNCQKRIEKLENQVTKIKERL